jgi:endonuclease YncB( thermonuclease family)
VQVTNKVLPTIGVAAVVGVALGVLITNGMLKPQGETEASDGPGMSAPGPELPIAPRPEAAVPEVGVHIVEKVISGDIVQLDTIGPARLLGIDTQQGPGGKPPLPDMAKGQLQRIVEGKSVIVDYDPATADSGFKDDLEMPLVYLTLDDGTLVNMELVARGGAVADLGRTYKHRDDLIKAERDARWAGRGLWESSLAKQPLTPLPPSSLPSVQRPPVVMDPSSTSIPADAVLVTSDGRFHKQSCRLGKGGVPMSAADARGKNYLACSQCFVSSKVKI